jgi:hypothetical protein
VYCVSNSQAGFTLSLLPVFHCATLQNIKASHSIRRLRRFPMPSRLVYPLVCLAFLASRSNARSDASQVATQQVQRTAQQQAVLAGQQATDQVLRQAQLSSYQYNQAMIQGAPAQMNYENLCCVLTESPKFSVKPASTTSPEPSRLPTPPQARRSTTPPTVGLPLSSLNGIPVPSKSARQLRSARLPFLRAPGEVL